MRLPVANKALTGWLLIACAIPSGCKDKGGQANQTAQSALTYKVAGVYTGPTTIYFNFPVTIQGEQNVEIRPKVDGFIQDIFIDEGAVVHKGQKLFQLNNPQYDQALRSAAASVKIAEADVLAAKMNVDKVRPLVEKDIISKYELESNQYTLQAKEAALASSQADLTNAKVNVGYTFLTSPADGVAGTIPYKVGSLVSSTSTSPLTTIYNTKNIYAYFSLNEKQLLQFSRATKGNTLQEKLAGMPDVSLLLADGSEYTHQGRITTVSGLITQQTGSATLRADFPNPNGLIRSGNTGTIRVPVDIRDAILIPQSATYDLQGKKFVFILHGGDSITNVAIQVSENTVGKLYVVEDGLKSGDKIVIQGISNLRSGMMIKPVPVNTDSLYSLMSHPNQ
jgi:membrane fusion protein, multidrug efflux system